MRIFAFRLTKNMNIEKDNISSTYLQRRDAFQANAAALQAKYLRGSMLRLIIFILGVGLGIYLGSWGWPYIIIYIPLFILFFGWLVKRHQQVQWAQQHQEQLAKVNELELRRLEFNLKDGDDGKYFLDPLHPYAIDLDLFGPYSFFQYTNRATTAIGKEQYANWLLEGAEKDELNQRQLAVKELSKMLEWRQNFQAQGLAAKDKRSHVDNLLEWLKSPDFVKNKAWVRAALWLSPVYAIIALGLAIFYLPWQASIFLLLPPALIIRKFLDQVNETHLRTTKANQWIGIYARLMQQIEEQSFESLLLKNIRKEFTQGGAAKSIQHLSYILSQLDVRYNAFAIILNLAGLWDLQWIYRLEKWKAFQREHLPQWFKALQQMEALNSLAALRYNHPDWVFPELHTDDLIDAKELGHPMIPDTERINNQFSSPTHGHLKLITGSNMAGKSTFLRTVGLNIVLAMAGAPVCAKELRLPLLRVYTSMRTQDALHESTSSFYAELKRLKSIIEAVQQYDNVYFLLDEILKGTNSRDRHTGGKALIQQMINSRGAGIIATHDLELGALEATANGSVENLCMEVEIKDGKLDFDYKLKKGVSQSFNATLLMRNMGINV